MLRHWVLAFAVLLFPASAGDVAEHACDFTGSWGTKVILPVSWTETAHLKAGRGTITLWLRNLRTQDGAKLSERVNLCGVELPAWQGKPLQGQAKDTTATYSLLFPDALFDRGTLPSSTASTSVSSTRPNADFTTTQLTITAGSTIADSPRDVWPTDSYDVFGIDADENGRPGVTLDVPTGPPYVAPPLAFWRDITRATKVDMAWRIRGSVTGTAISCNRFEGVFRLSGTPNHAAVERAVLGCLRDDGQNCTHSQIDLLHRLQPTYNLSGTAKVTAERLSPRHASCADIRQL